MKRDRQEEANAVWGFESEEIREEEICEEETP
jgi:hypothetical protein